MLILDLEEIHKLAKNTGNKRKLSESEICSNKRKQLKASISNLKENVLMVQGTAVNTGFFELLVPQTENLDMSNDNKGKTPPGGIVKRSNLRLSRKSTPVRMHHKQDTSIDAQSPTTPQRSHNGFTTVQCSPSLSCVTPTRIWCASQDPAREIVWDYNPVSPLTKTTRNIGKAENLDFMNNLCQSWKMTGKTSSPTGSESLLKQWIKPQSLHLEFAADLKASELCTGVSSHSSVPLQPKSLNSLTRELQMVQKLILNRTEHKDSSPEMVKTQECLFLTIPQKKGSSTLIVKEPNQSTLGNFENLNTSCDIFDEEDVVLAPDSCDKTCSEDDMWGDDDESFLKKLSQTELLEADKAFCSSDTQPSTIPSTLSCEESDCFLSKNYVKTRPNQMDIFHTLEEVNLTRYTKVQDSSKKNENRSNGNEWNSITRNGVGCGVVNANSSSKINERSAFKCGRSKQVQATGNILIDLTDSADEFDLFDDDFVLSQEVLSVIDQKDITIPSEPTLSQKRRASNEEIARKKTEALKLRQNKMKKSNPIIGSSKTKTSVRSNSGMLM